MPHFQFSPQASKYLEPPLFPSHPLSASTHVTPCSMADHQALLLNLHGRSISSSPPPTTHHYRNPAKIKSRPPARPKPSQNQIVKKNPEAHQITNQITPTEIKTQNPQNNQNHKMKTLKVNPPLKKHILVLLLYFRRRIILLN